MDTYYGDKIYNKKGKTNDPTLISQTLFGSNNVNQSVLGVDSSSKVSGSSVGKSSSGGSSSLSARQAADLLRPFVKPEYRNNLERTILNTLRKK